MSLRRLVLFSDLDGTLVGHSKALHSFQNFWRALKNECDATLVYNTGRTRSSFNELLEENTNYSNDLRSPDYFIGATGCELFTPGSHSPNEAWTAKLAEHNWDVDVAHRVCGELGCLVKQPEENQHRFRAAYFCKPDDSSAAIDTVQDNLRAAGIMAHVHYCCGRFFDIVSVDGGKGGALKHLVDDMAWAGPDVIACGDSGNDVDMFDASLSLGGRVILVGNSEEAAVKWWQEHEGDGRVYFAQKKYALGVVEGLQHFGFGDKIQLVSE